MRSKAIIWTAIVLVGVIGFLAIYFIGREQQQESSDITLEDEPEARALYEKMMETMRIAETLSYESSCSVEVEGEEIGRCTYTIWMRKPNFFYAEAINEDDKNKGILVGDGRYAWNYWPNGRPSFSGEDYDVYKKSRFNVYMKEPAPPGKYSIAYAVVLQKSNCFPILDPSVFQGIKDSLEPYIDWIKTIGAEKVGDEECDVIEVSFMKHQRSQFFWISVKDNLPRKLKEVVRTNEDIITHEVWSKVTVNAEIPAEKFAWTPPADWRQWYPPGPEDKLLKLGQNAPDFELNSVHGGKIKLSGYRGKIVWLYIWRAG